MQINKVKIFFDESGKQADRPTTMGGLLIPSLVYDNEIIQKINDKLNKKEFHLHWKNYSGHSETKALIKESIDSIMKFSSLISFNIINYKKPIDKNCDQLLFEDMIYTKLPERILYGLLRDHGNNAKIDVEIFIERATEYEKRKLKEKITQLLNIHAIYRGQNYNIINCYYKEKNEEIGVEITDLLLGIIRSIILNKDDSNKSKRKNELIVELLKNKNFYSFLLNINYFEWSNDNDLKKIDFKHYIQLFLAKQENWIQYLIDHKQSSWL